MPPALLGEFPRRLGGLGAVYHGFGGTAGSRGVRAGLLGRTWGGRGNTLLLMALLTALKHTEEGKAAPELISIIISVISGSF